MQALNQQTFLLINQLAGKFNWLDQLAIALAEFTPYAFILLLIIVWFFADRDKRYASFLAGFSVLLAMAFSYLIGKFFFHPRPFMDNLGMQLVSHAPDTSFPSDHTTFVFAIAFSFLFYLANKSLGWWLVAISLVSGIARVFVAVHYPGDILGALGVGALAAGIIFSLNSFTSGLNTIYMLFNFLRLPTRAKE